MKKLIIILLSVFTLIMMSNFNIKASPTIYSNYINGKNAGSNLIYEPTLILELNDLNELNDVANKNITSVILKLDKDMKIHVGSETYPMDEFFDTYIKGKYIPIFTLDKSNCDEFINHYKTVYSIYDSMIISNDLEVIGKVYKDSSTYILNSIYDMRGIKLPEGRYANWEYVKECNKVGCNILFVNSNDPNIRIFSEYVEAMTKVCWAYTTSKLECIEAISCGSLGIVGIHSNDLVDGIRVYSKSGWQMPQYLAAHRGITKYCNENSLTSCMAAYSEGATHIEIDLQVLADGNVVLCHNSQTNFNSDKNGWYFVNVLLENLQKAHLNDYNVNYDETYSTVEELLDNILKTDIIIIFELKFDNGSKVAVDDLACIENFKRIIDSNPLAYGHFYTITFFAPLAEKMKELMPEVPIGYLGGAKSGKETTLNQTAWQAGGGHKEMMDYAGKIKFLRHYNIGLDESYIYASTSGQYYSNLTAQTYLAHGYVQNTWTYDDLKNFANKTIVATSNKVEDCAYLIKSFDDDIILSKEDVNIGKKVVKTYTYNGWQRELECEIIKVNEDSQNIQVLLYYYEEASTPYGLYSRLINVKK